MVTRSKKPEAEAPVKKASKPKAAAGNAAANTTPKASSAAKPKAAVKTAAKAAPKKAAPKTVAKTATKAAPKKTAAKTAAKAAPKKAAAKKTVEVVRVPEGRKIGDMIYNDELLESMAEIILLGSDGISTAALPEIKKQLFDYDVYMVSFLTDKEVGNLAKSLKVPEAALLTVRDNARAFVELATIHNSVRAFIDKTLQAEGKGHIKSKLKAAPEHCESFLLLF